MSGISTLRVIQSILWANPSHNVSVSISTA